MKKNSFVEGTVIAAIAILLTKVFGALYVIPFYSIIGENGGVLYSYAYNIYNLFLNISTAGIPVAVSMIISEYSSLKKYEAKERAYKISKKVIIIISLISFLIVFFGSDIIGSYFLRGIEGGNKIEDVSLVIKAISFCLLIIPFLSVLRGYLQGNKYIAASSVSQVIEQIVRIAIILIGSYLAINVFKTSIPIGVSVALSGAFFGGLIAYLYLKIKTKKEKNLFKEEEKTDNVTNKEIIKKIISYCIPLIITAIVANLYDLVDMKLIIKGLYMIGYPAKDSELISSIICTWGPKICMIIIAVSMGLVTSLIPHIISSYTKNDLDNVNKIFNQAISMILAITVPMGIGIILLSEPIYYLFYGASKYGPLILKYLAVVNVLAGILSVINNTLQGVKKFKIIYLNSIVGLSVNAILDIPMILFLNKIGIHPFYGTIISTIIGFIISYIIVFIYLKKEFKFNYSQIKTVIKKMIIPCLSMIALIVLLDKTILPVKSISYTYSILIIIVYAILASLLYFVIMYKNNGLYESFGKEYINKILKKLHIQK